MTQFFGKYRGKVKSNIDPLLLGRIQVSVPAVLGDGQLSWAMPCVPYAGPGVGFFAVPPVGANVWVEFEGGNPDYPIWSGCFWGEGQAPAQPAVAEMKVFKTETVTLVLNDLDGVGGFTLEVNPPAVPTPLKMVFDAGGIALSNGEASIKLQLSGVSLSHTTAAIRVEPASLAAENGLASVKLEPAAISVENGAASIKLTPASISLNNGALEVT